MIVFYDDAIGEVEPVGASAAEMQGALIEQAPGSFSGSGNAGGGAAPEGAFLQAARNGGDAAHTLQEVQAEALEGENCALRSCDAHQGVTCIEIVAVFFFEDDIQALGAQEPGVLGETGGDSRLARNNLGVRRFVSYSQRGDGDIARKRVGFSQGIENGSDGAQVCFIGESKFGAAKEGLFDVTPARVRHVVAERWVHDRERCAWLELSRHPVYRGRETRSEGETELEGWRQARSRGAREAGLYFRRRERSLAGRGEIYEWASREG